MSAEIYDGENLVHSCLLTCCKVIDTFGAVKMFCDIFLDLASM